MNAPSKWILLLTAGFILLSLKQVQAQQSREIHLAGYKMNPKVATSGSGFLTLQLHNDTLSVDGDFKNLNGIYSGASIMVRIRGQAGNQLYRLKAQLNDERTGGTFEAKQNSFILSAAEKQLLKDGALYIIISSFNHRGGEIRADIPPMG